MFPIRISTIGMMESGPELPASTLNVLVGGRRFALPGIPHTTDPNTGADKLASYDKLCSVSRYREYLVREAADPHGAVGYALRALLHHLRGGRPAVIECKPQAAAHATVFAAMVNVLDLEEPAPATVIVAVATGERQSTDIEAAAGVIEANQTRPDLPADRLFSYYEAGRRRWALCYDTEGELTMITDTGEFVKMPARLRQVPCRRGFTVARSWWQLRRAALDHETVDPLPRDGTIDPYDLVMLAAHGTFDFHLTEIYTSLNMEALLPDAAYDAIAAGYYRTLRAHREHRDRIVVRGLAHPHYHRPAWTFSDEQFRDNELTDDPLAYELETHGMFDRLDNQDYPAAEWLNRQGLDDPDVTPSMFQDDNLIQVRTHIATYLRNRRRGLWADAGKQRPQRLIGPLQAAAQAWADANYVRALHEFVKPVYKVKPDGTVLWMPPKMQARRPGFQMWLPLNWAPEHVRHAARRS